jgi:ribonuclease D
MHSYFHKVCLIQASVAGANYLIDPLALEESELMPLWRVVADPSIGVLMHGADYDVRILDRDYDARVTGLLDTQIMAQFLGEEKTGLAVLLDKELDVRLDKKYQRADWGRRPLYAAQLEYAAADTAYLEQLTDRLCPRLEEMGRWAWVVGECRELERVRHTPVENGDTAFEKIKGARSLRGHDRDRLFTLYRWRDSVAQKMDVPPFKILGNKPLLALATAPPTDLDALGVVDGIGPRAVRRWGRDLLKRLRRPKKAPVRRRTSRPPNPSHEVRRRIKKLTAARDAVAVELGLKAGLLCSRSRMESLAACSSAAPTSADLADCGLDGWRLEVLGDCFAEALASD